MTGLHLRLSFIKTTEITQVIKKKKQLKKLNLYQLLMIVPHEEAENLN